MKPRRPRLGGIVDDYCSRERRITDHAVVAMVEDEIKQTRCTTCDDEHAYKGAKIPAARKKNSTLYQQVLAGKGDPDASARPSPSLATAARGNGRTAGAERAAAAASGDTETADRVDGGTGEGLPLAADEVRVHRQLIRATLPRPEGQVQARPLPEFTIRQSGSFDGQYENDARRPARGGRGHAGPPDGQPGNRRGGDGSKPRRPHRPPHGRGQSAAGNTADPPGGRPRSRSRRSRSSSRNRKRSK